MPLWVQRSDGLGEENGEEPNLRVGEQCHNKRKQVLFQGNLVLNLIHTPFTKTSVSNFSPAKSPPDHHPSPNFTVEETVVL